MKASEILSITINISYVGLCIYLMTTGEQLSDRIMGAMLFLLFWAIVILVDDEVD